MPKQCTHLSTGSRILFVSWKPNRAKNSFHFFINNQQPETKDSSHKLGNTNILIYGILSAKNRKRMIFLFFHLIDCHQIKNVNHCLVYCFCGRVFLGLLSSLSRQSSVNATDCDQAKWNDILYSKDVFLKMILLNFARFLPFLAIAQIFAVPCLCFSNLL